MASLPIVGAEASTTCSLGPGLGAAIFFLFFPVVKEPFEGCQMQEEHTIPFFIMRLLSFQALRESKVELRVRSSVLKNCKKN